MLERLIEQGNLPFSWNLEEVGMPFNYVLDEVSSLKGTWFCTAEIIENFLIYIMRRLGSLL
jgi:hypothetical protein